MIKVFLGGGGVSTRCFKVEEKMGRFNSGSARLWATTLQSTAQSAVTAGLEENNLEENSDWKEISCPIPSACPHQQSGKRR